MIDIKQLVATQDFYRTWAMKSSLKDNKSVIHMQLAEMYKQMSFLDDIVNFGSVDEFTSYIISKLVAFKYAKDERPSKAFKGWIFELFCLSFLNYFTTFSIHTKRDNTVKTFVINSVCCLNPIETNDYGIDLVCRIADRTGISKNAVIQVKFRSGNEFMLKADIMDKLHSQGVKNGIIEGIGPGNKDKILILFTNLGFPEYKATFENNSLFENLLIIDKETINDLIPNMDFWMYFKGIMNGIVNYKR